MIDPTEANVTLEARERLYAKRPEKNTTGVYRENTVAVARICDEEIDRRGHLLGYVRTAARAR